MKKKMLQIYNKKYVCGPVQGFFFQNWNNNVISISNKYKQKKLYPKGTPRFMPAMVKTHQWKHTMPLKSPFSWGHAAPRPPSGRISSLFL